MENSFLARQLLRVILGREGDVQILLLADGHADHLLFKARDEGVAADLEGLVLGGAAGELHAVHAAGVIEVHGVAFGNRAVVNGDLGGLLVALLLDLGVHLVLGHEGVLALDLNALVLAQGHVRLDEHFAGELQVLAGADLLDIDLRTIDDLELVLVDGRAVHLVEDQLERLVIEDAFAVHVLDHLARGVSLAEAGDRDLAAHLDVCLAHRLVELGRVDVKGKFHLIAGNLFNSGAHALMLLYGNGCAPEIPKRYLIL